MNMLVSREITNKLNAYKKLLLLWNKKINLMSKNIDLEKHLMDCMQLMSMIKSTDIDLVDVGSGGGLPGLILSIAGVRKVTLIEPNQKKAIFLLHASSISDNKIEVANCRAEEIETDCDILTSKAFADLDVLFESTKKIKVRDKYLLLKSDKYKDEISIAQKKWSFNLESYDSIVFDYGKIIEITNLTEKYANNSCSEPERRSWKDNN